MFVTTNFIVTPKQKMGNCSEVKLILTVSFPLEVCSPYVSWTVKPKGNGLSATLLTHQLFPKTHSGFVLFFSDI